MRPGVGDRRHAYEDLTARARIRDAALWHFAEEGFSRATIRDIAATAGVSPGLVRHHFGSKEGLRDACDEAVSQRLRRSRLASAARCQRRGVCRESERRPGRRRDLPAGAAPVSELYLAGTGRRITIGGAALRRTGVDDRAVADPG